MAEVPVRVRETISVAQQCVQPGMWFGGVPAGPRIWRAFTCSVCAHALTVWVGASYWNFVATLRRDTVAELNPSRVLELSLDVIEHRRITAPPSTAAPPGVTAIRSRGRSVSSTPTKTQHGAGVPPENPAPAREFRMPPPRTARTPAQTLVQLDLPPTFDLHQQLRVPELVMLANTNLRRVPAPFVAPSQRKRADLPSAVVLDLHPPIVELHPGYVKPAEELARVSAVVPPPSGATSPVASHREPLENIPAATVTGISPAAANIVSLPDRPIPAASAIVLPPLNQIGGQTGSSSDMAHLDTNSDPGRNGQRGSAAPGEAGAVKGSGAGSHASANGSATLAGVAAGEPGLASASPSIGGSALPAGTPSMTGSPAIAGSPANGPAITGGASGTPQTARMVRTRGGQYELAVVQSSSGVPGSAGLLTGRPVYSVYVAVGTSKDWILQYCLPASETARPRPAQVVLLSSIAPLTAPYAYSISRPDARFQPGARYAFIHGFVNSSGRFEQLAAVGDPALENSLVVLDTLQQWEFRPASKDGVPTLVEILLCIANPGV